MCDFGVHLAEFGIDLLHYFSARAVSINVKREQLLHFAESKPKRLCAPDKTEASHVTVRVRAMTG
jgi:hypothetical protein